MWKDSIRNTVVIFQPNILRIVGFYVRHSAIELNNFKLISCDATHNWHVEANKLLISKAYNQY